MSNILTITKAKQKMEDGSLSSEELVRSCLDTIKQHNPKLNAVLSVFDTAVEEAKKIDVRRRLGESMPPLAGIPILLKDNMLVFNEPSTSGSRILEGHKGVYDATVVRRLREAGAILLGRTNMDEFAMGSSTENSHFGPTKNPWDKMRVPGGSSGGSACAVSVGMAPCALGSDTGGSIRQPAALCGVVGLKPTYGRVSRYGLMSLASSFDQIGPFTRTVEDAALVMQAIEGRDPRDATSMELSDTTVSELLERDVKGMRIGIPKEYFVEGMDEDVKTRVMDAVRVFEIAGAQVQETSLPHTSYALAAYYIIMPAEASSNLGRFDGIRYGFSSQAESLTGSYERTRGEWFGREAQRRIMLGTYILSKGYYDAYYRKALQVRTLIKRDFDEAFKLVDAIVAPTSPSVAWPIGEKFNDPLTMYLSDIYTISANLATIPAMSIPCGFVNDLPVGLQLMARPFGETTLYRLGNYYQSVTDWGHRVP